MSTTTSLLPGARPVRDAADDYVRQLAELDPLTATAIGLPGGEDRLPDYSPAGEQAENEVRRATLARLADLQREAGASGGFLDADERRCARLLRERLQTEIAVSEAGENQRRVSNIFGPPQWIRGAFLLMPTATPEDWALIARRLNAVPESLAGYRASLAAGRRRGLQAAPRQIRSLADQLASWQASGAGTGWFTGFVAAADGSDPLHADLAKASAAADAALADLRDWLLAYYLPGSADTPDGAGKDRYLLGARLWNGAQLDLAETYEWGWSQFRDISAQMREEAERVQPGATVAEAMQYLDTHGDIVNGTEEVRRRLQDLMNQAMADLDGTHFDLPDQVKAVEAMIAPAGTAAAPYYTLPSQDFARPGRTWLPTMGRTSFPFWGLISTWHHEGVPGHHMQLAQWQYLADRLSMYQASVGGVAACIEGWALYAQRLMDELGYLEAPGARLGYLRGQLSRAIRVIADIGMHLELKVAADSPTLAGQAWTAELAADFLAAHNGRPPEFAQSEVIRYLSAPGQAISYKLGERAWLAGREAARTARGAEFDLKSWHMAALSLGSLGLDDLEDELAGL